MKRVEGGRRRKKKLRDEGKVSPKEEWVEDEERSKI